jgi:uncharacterized protein HemX
MKEKIKKILTVINSWKVILLIILIGIGLFYWYQIRPSIIYSKCHMEATEEARQVLKEKVRNFELGAEFKKAAQENMFLKDDYETAYKGCLRKHGINK